MKKKLFILCTLLLTAALLLTVLSGCGKKEKLDESTTESTVASTASDVLTTYVDTTEIVGVTDESGEVMTDANGNSVTQAIPVTNASGQKVTEAVRVNGVELATGDFDEGWY